MFARDVNANDRVRKNGWYPDEPKLYSVIYIYIYITTEVKLVTTNKYFIVYIFFWSTVNEDCLTSNSVNNY